MLITVTATKTLIIKLIIKLLQRTSLRFHGFLLFSVTRPSYNIIPILGCIYICSHASTQITSTWQPSHTSIPLTLKDGIRCSLSLCLTPSHISFCVSDPHTECTLCGLSAPVRQRCRISPVNDWTQCVAAIHIHLFSINVIYVFFMLPLGLERFSVLGLCMLMAPSHLQFPITPEEWSQDSVCSHQ